MTQSAIQKTIKGLVATGILFLGAVISMGFLSHSLADANYWTIHTHRVIEELKDSLSALQDVETGERGYLVTSEPEFLEPYQTGSSTVMAHINQVQSLTTDNHEQQNAVKKLRELAEQKIEQSQTSIRTRPEVGNRASLVSTQHKSKQIMDAYRAQIKGMIGNEERLLNSRLADLRTVQYAIWTTTAMLAACASFLLYWVFQITRTAIGTEKRRVDELSAEVEQRKHTEKVLKETTTDLAASNSSLQQFAYVAAHDLREPLRTVVSYTNLLSEELKGKLSKDAEENMAFIVDAGKRMQQLISDLLTYSRIDTQAKLFVLTDCETVFVQTVASMKTTIEEAKGQITHDALPTVMADASQFSQLLLNLLGNALKFHGSEPPEIHVSARQEDVGDEWIFSVKDNGIGIDIKFADRIFQMFQRLHGMTEYSGTGIGLSVCKRIVERHGGRIWFESTLGQGTVFFFSIPVRDPIP